MLDKFQNRCLRILGIQRPDLISNDELCRRHGVPPVSKKVKKRRWKRIGHVLKMQPSEHPRKALKWLSGGRRNVDLEKKTWQEAREVATNRTEWKDSLKSCVPLGHS